MNYSRVPPSSPREIPVAERQQYRPPVLEGDTARPVDLQARGSPLPDRHGQRQHQPHRRAVQHIRQEAGE